MSHFGHAKLTDSEQFLVRVNLVSERSANLGGCERHSPVVVFDELPKVDEDSLGRLWSQVAVEVASRPNISLKHQVERLGFGEGIARVGVSDAQIKNNLIQLCSRQILNIEQDSLQLSFFFGFLFLGQDLLDVLFNQFISSPGISLDHIFDHKICEFINVS